MSKGKEFYKLHGAKLRAFLYEAQIHTYGSSDAKPEATPDGGQTLQYPPNELNEDGFLYIDRWYGGEPYSGIAVVLQDGIPCWSVSYWGRIMPITGLNQQRVLNCLHEALQHPLIDTPWRGSPKLAASNGLLYYNEMRGGMRRFSGHEIIRTSGSKQVLYEAFSRGGIINKDQD